MSKIKGNELMIFLDDRSIAYATNHTLTIQGETSENENKDESVDDWANADIKKLSWNCSTENLYSEDGKGKLYDDLEMLMVTHTKIPVIMNVRASSYLPNAGYYPKSSVHGSTPYWSYEGNAIINDLELNAPVGDYATFSCQFEGVGALKKTFVINVGTEDPDPSYDDADEFVLEQNGSAYPYYIYFYNSTGSDGFLKEIRFEPENFTGQTQGLTVGDRIHLANVLFEMNKETNSFEWGGIDGTVKSINSTSGYILITPDNAFDKFKFVDTDFEYDQQEDEQEILYSGVQLTAADYPDLVDGQYVMVKLNHMWQLLYGKINGRVTNNTSKWRVDAYFWRS